MRIEAHLKPALSEWHGTTGWHPWLWYLEEGSFHYDLKRSLILIISKNYTTMWVLLSFTTPSRRFRFEVEKFSWEA